MNSLSMDSFTEKTLLFAVNTATVLLSVHVQGLWLLNTLLPPFTEIPVKKWNPLLPADALSGFPDQFMILEPAVKKGWGEGIEFSFFCHLCGCIQSVMIAESAPILFPENHRLKKAFQLVGLLIDDPEVLLFAVWSEGLLSFYAFGPGMNVMAIEKAHKFYTFLLKNLQWIYGAGSTAHV